MNNITIDSISCLEFETQGKIYYSDNKSYLHQIVFEDNSGDSLERLNVYLVSEEPFSRIPQKVLNSSMSKIEFEVSANSVENSKICFVEMEVVSQQGETKTTRIPITLVKVSVQTTGIPVELGSTPLLSSNLLYPRIRLGFAQWSSVEKNDISNTTKILEPLFTPLYDSYHKVIKLGTKSKIKDSYKKMRSIITYKRPVGIRQYNKEQSNLLFEGTSVERYPQRLSTTPSPKLLKMIKFYISPTSDITEDINELASTLLYVKRTTSVNMLKYIPVVIKGEDQFGDYLEETIFVTTSFYSIGTKRFSRITDIVTSEHIVIANHVNCLYDHYIIKDHKTPAPIVDKTLFQFTPYCLLSTNVLGTRTHLQIFKEPGYTEHCYKFDLDYVSDQSISFFLDEHLRIVWCDRSKLYSSVLGHDLSKHVGNHPSTNNNKVILVRDQNTPIGDWIEAVVDVENWPDKTPMLINIRNKDTILYYDQDTESFTTTVKYFYPRREEKVIELNVKVDNEYPYIFSVITDDMKTKYLAVSHSNKLHNYLKDVVATGDLVHFDGKLVTVNNNLNSIVTPQKTVSDRLQLIISPKNVKTFEWVIDINGHVISSKGSSLPSELFEIKSASGYNCTDVIIDLDRKGLLDMYSSEEANLNIICNSDPTFSNNTVDVIEVSCNDKYGLIVKNNEGKGDIKYQLKISKTDKEFL